MDPKFTPFGEYRECAKCAFDTTENIVKCPKCGKDLSTETKLRSHGQLMVVLGGFLILMVGAVIIGVTGIFVYGVYFAERSNFTKPSSSALIFVTYIFLGSLFVFSIAGVIAGRHQTLHGRRHPTAMKYAMWVLAAGLAITGIFQTLIG